MAILAGSMFGAGLLISGMTNTLKVQGWLDVFGNWDPTLAFVMGGGVIPMALAWAYSKGRKPALGGEFPTFGKPEADKTSSDKTNLNEPAVDANTTENLAQAKATELPEPKEPKA